MLYRLRDLNIAYLLFRTPTVLLQMKPIQLKHLDALPYNLLERAVVGQRCAEL